MSQHGIGGLNVTWRHVPTYNLTKQEFILDVAQLSGYTTQRTISPSLYLSDANFNLNVLNSNNLNITAYQYQAVNNNYYNYTETGTCANLSSSTLFKVYDGTNPTLYHVGDVVSYIGEDYKNKQTVYNYNGVPSSLTQYWQDIGISISTNSTNSTNSTWNYPSCTSIGENVVVKTGIIPYSQGSSCNQANITCVPYTIITYKPAQIGSGPLPIANSMFLSPTLMQHTNGQQTEVGDRKSVV